MVCRRSLVVPAVGRSLLVCVCVCVCLCVCVSVCLCVAVVAVELNTVRKTKRLLQMTGGILPLPWVYSKDVASLPESGLKNVGVIPTIQLESGLGKVDWTQLSSDVTHWLLTMLSLFSLRPVGC